MIGLPLEGEKILFGASIKHSRLHLRLHRKRDMHGHLVTIEIGIVCRAHQRMDADCLPFDQLWLKSLDRETVQSRSTIQQHRVTLGDFIKDVPNLGRLPLNQFLGAAHSVNVALLLESPNDEWFEQNQGHLFRQARTG